MTPQATTTVPCLNGTTENYRQRIALFNEWRRNPESAPDWFELVDLLDELMGIEEASGSCPLPMTDETFDEEDMATVKELAPNLPFVLCSDYDPLGGDSVEGALQGLLTEGGRDRIQRLCRIAALAREFCGKQGWR